MSKNNPLQHFDINKEMRSQLKNQKPCVIWLTGISGAGKSTIANALDKRLNSMGKHTYVLDGDNVRNGLCNDLSFTDEDRKENIRRVAEVAKLMVDAGLIVITAFISPFEKERQMARELFKKGEFFEVFVNTSFQVAEKRDAKGFYKKAKKGEISDFTGVGSQYEAPRNSEISLNGVAPLDELTEEILFALNLDK